MFGLAILPIYDTLDQQHFGLDSALSPASLLHHKHVSNTVCKELLITAIIFIRNVTTVILSITLEARIDTRSTAA